MQPSKEEKSAELPTEPGTNEDGVTWAHSPNSNDYLVSDDGRVVSLKRGSPQLLSPIQFDKEKKDHLRIVLFIEGERRQWLLHRLVVASHVGSIAPNQVVHHRNEDPSDNRLSNLVVMSKSAHQRHHASRLPPETIATIKGLCERDEIGIGAIASHYDLDRSYIYKVMKGGSWGDVQATHPPSSLVDTLKEAT